MIAFFGLKIEFNTKFRASGEIQDARYYPSLGVAYNNGSWRVLLGSLTYKTLLLRRCDAPYESRSKNNHIAWHFEKLYGEDTGLDRVHKKYNYWNTDDHRIVTYIYYRGIQNVCIV